MAIELRCIDYFAMGKMDAEQLKTNIIGILLSNNKEDVLGRVLPVYKGAGYITDPTYHKGQLEADPSFCLKLRREWDIHSMCRSCPFSDTYANENYDLEIKVISYLLNHPEEVGKIKTNIPFGIALKAVYCIDYIEGIRGNFYIKLPSIIYEAFLLANKSKDPSGGINIMMKSLEDEYGDALTMERRGAIFSTIGLLQSKKVTEEEFMEAYSHLCSLNSLLILDESSSNGKHKKGQMVEGQTSLVAFSDSDLPKKAPRDFSKKKRSPKDKSNDYNIEQMQMLDGLLDAAVQGNQKTLVEAAKNMDETLINKPTLPYDAVSEEVHVCEEKNTSFKALNEPKLKVLPPDAYVDAHSSKNGLQGLNMSTVSDEMNSVTLNAKATRVFREGFDRDIYDITQKEDFETLVNYMQGCGSISLHYHKGLYLYLKNKDLYFYVADSFLEALEHYCGFFFKESDYLKLCFSRLDLTLTPFLDSLLGIKNLVSLVDAAGFIKSSNLKLDCADLIYKNTGTKYSHVLSTMAYFEGVSKSIFHQLTESGLKAYEDKMALYTLLARSYTLPSRLGLDVSLFEKNDTSSDGFSFVLDINCLDFVDRKRGFFIKANLLNDISETDVSSVYKSVCLDMVNRDYSRKFKLSILSYSRSGLVMHADTDKLHFQAIFDIFHQSLIRNSKLFISEDIVKVRVAI